MKSEFCDCILKLTQLFKQQNVQSKLIKCAVNCCIQFVHEKKPKTHSSIKPPKNTLGWAFIKEMGFLNPEQSTHKCATECN